MGALFAIVAPVFALIGLGAAAIRLRLLDAGAVKGMSDFVFYLAMPSLLFRSMVTAPPLRLLDVAGSFILGAFLLFAAAALLSRVVLRARLSTAGVFALNAVFGNTVMLGVPIIDSAFGAEGLAYLLAIVAFHAALLLPLATILIEADGGPNGRRPPLDVLRAVMPGLLRNPVVMVIVAALLWRTTGLGLAEPVERLLLLLGAAGPPLALFCLGATLPKPEGLKGLRDVILASALKLLVMPALVAGLAWMSGVRGVAFSVVVLAAAMPTGANAFLLARRFGTMMEASASTVVVSTALSLLTLTALLGWLR
jgi:malonate transporter and related proteins